MSPIRGVRTYLQRVRSLIRAGRSRIADYALERAFEELGWDEVDILAAVTALTPADFLRRDASLAVEGGDIWIFTPLDASAGRLWIRLTIRDDLIVVSFHEA